MEVGNYKENLKNEYTFYFYENDNLFLNFQNVIYF